MSHWWQGERDEKLADEQEPDGAHSTYEDRFQATEPEDHGWTLVAEADSLRGEMIFKPGWERGGWVPIERWR